MLSHRVADYMQYATANLEQLHADGRGDCVLCMADLRADDVTESVPDAQGLTAVPLPSLWSRRNHPCLRARVPV